VIARVRALAVGIAKAYVEQQSKAAVPAQGNAKKDRYQPKQETVSAQTGQD
jgi:hypothetical protein